MLEPARGQATTRLASRPRARGRPGLGLRMRVWAGALGLDRRLAEGASPASSPELSLRARQLVGDRSTRALSSALTAAVRAAWRSQGRWARTSPIAAPGVREAAAGLEGLARDLVTMSDPPVRGVALTSFLVCDPVSPLYNGHSPVTVAEVADRARSALRSGREGPSPG